MSYLRWLCAMHFAKLTRHGSAFVETVNAFRVHRQQKTLACEAAAKARAEFWARFADNMRKIRSGQLSAIRTTRSSQQHRQLDHINPNNMNFRESGIEAEREREAGSFHSATQRVCENVFRREQRIKASQNIIPLSALLRNSLCQKGNTIIKLLQQTKETIISGFPQLSQQQKRKLSAKSVAKEFFTTPRKSLAMFTLSKSDSWPNGKSPVELQNSTQQTNQKVTTETNKPTDDSFFLVCSTPPDKSKDKAKLSLQTMQNAASESASKQKAMLLPERPNVLVLPKLKDPNVRLNDGLHESHTNCCGEPLKLLPAPANTLKSTPYCKISTEPADCMLPPHCDNPMSLLVSNVLDKYKIISLPAGRAIPGQPRRHMEIPKRKRNPIGIKTQPDVKRKKY